MTRHNMNNAMPLKLTAGVLSMLFSAAAFSQEQPADTIVVPLAQTSKIIFTVQDRRDLEVLKHYNFQELFRDIIRKLETNDSDSAQNETGAQANMEGDRTASDAEDKDDRLEDGNNDENRDAGNSNDHDPDDHKWEKSRRGRIGQTWQSYNVDLGTNNYLAEDQFPDGSEPYAVRPWGSWYLGVNSVQRTRLGRNVFVEWGMGVSWYSFKFQDANTLLLKDGPALQFATDMRDVDHVKSKLSATFVNASLVPVLDFGDHSQKRRMWDGHGGGFRLGVGPYVGYRISSKTKLVYETGGDRKKEKDHDSYYLNNLRYGFRVQVGVRSTDLFINYDMNELFAKDKGPKLNAISFGLIF